MPEVNRGLRAVLRERLSWPEVPGCVLGCGTVVYVRHGKSPCTWELSPAEYSAWPPELEAWRDERAAAGLPGCVADYADIYVQDMSLAEILRVWPAVADMPLTTAQCAELELQINMHGPGQVRGVTYTSTGGYVGIQLPALFIGIERDGHAHT